MLTAVPRTGPGRPSAPTAGNGYRTRPWDTRAGTIQLAIPKVREGAYFPDFLIEPRRRAEHAVVSAVAEAYVLGVSTRKVDKLVRAMGMDGISRSRAHNPKVASSNLAPATP